MRHLALRCVILSYVACQLFSLTSTCYAIDAEWLAPVDGDWSDATRWSTDPLSPIGAGDSALLDATGTAYTTTISQNTSIDTVTINSPDASLFIDHAEFSASSGIHIDQGTLWVRGGTLSNTRVEGAGTFSVSYNNGYPTLDSVEIATDVSGTNLILKGANVLENATLSFRAGILHAGGSLTGNGTWLLGNFGTPLTTNQFYNINLEGGGEFTLGSGVELRPGSWNIEFKPIGDTTFVNQGTVTLDQSHNNLRFLRVRNEGTMSVTNGARLEMITNHNVGQVNIGDGGYLRLTGDPYFNVPLIVGNDAELYVTDSGNPQSSGLPIELQNGGEITVTSIDRVPKISANGGQVILNSTYTPTLIAQLPITGNATLRTGYSGGLDLEGGTLDYTTLQQNFNTVGTKIHNGIFTGPNTILEFGHPTLEGRLTDLILDVPGKVSEGTVVVRNTSTISQPFEVNGGELQLQDQWVNTGGITVNSGVLGIDSLPANPADIGTINFAGGGLRIGSDLTLTELQNFPIALPDHVSIAKPNIYASTPTLDLESSTLELATLPYQLAIESGKVINGTMLGDNTLPVIELGFNANFDNVEFNYVTLNSPNGYATFSNTAIRNSVVTGNSIHATNYLNSITIENSVLDTDVEFRDQMTTIIGHLEINGLFGGQRNSVISLAPGATLGGTGIIGNTTGRIQGETLEIVDPQFTIPANLSLVSATQYDSTDKVSAPNTQLRIEADITAGFETTFGNSRTDSWTFEVASLETLGAINVSLDGIFAVQSGPWKHAGVLSMNDGLVQVEGVTIAPTGSIVGDGTLQATAGLIVEGGIQPGENLGVLTIDGDLNLTASATLVIELLDTESGIAFNQLDVTGSTTLGGMLQVTADPTLNVEIGDFFPVLNTSGDLFFEFEDFTLPALNNGKTFRLLYGESLVGLEVITDADFNGDGNVNVDDLNDPALGWEARYGNDLNGGDFLAWQHQVGSNFGNGSNTTSAVPEPSSRLLFLLALLASQWRRLDKKD